MNNLKQKILALPVVEEILVVSAELKLKVFLAGGTIRDYLLSDTSSESRLDIDLVIEGDILPFGRALAEKTGGSFFMMDEKRKIGRIFLKNHSAGRITVDLSPLREKSIEDDLRLRDFTMNSIAADLAVLSTGEAGFLVDPCNGISDISKRVIRKSSENIFDDDPLRIMRAIRFEAQFSLSLERETESLIIKKISGISDVSGERIRDEIFMGLRSGRPSRFFQRASSTGILEALFPTVGRTGHKEAGDRNYRGFWDKAITHIEKYEALLNEIAMSFKEFQFRIKNLLNRKIEDRISLKELSLLASLLHDAEKNGVSEICKRLKLGRRACKVLQDISLFRRLYTDTIHEAAVSDRSLLFSFFRDAGETGIIIALLSISEIRGGTKGDIHNESEKTAKTLIRYYYTEFVNLKPLLSGKDLKSRFMLEPGPLYKKILDNVNLLNAAGRLGNKEEAMKYVERSISTRFKE